MSREHVAAMNSVLADAADVRSACGLLPRPYVIAYRLSDGPDGAVVHWTVGFDDTVWFDLAEHPRPDLVIIGDWSEMVRASAAGRQGESAEPAVRYEGDEVALTLTNAVLERARAVATFPVEFPAV